MHFISLHFISLHFCPQVVGNRRFNVSSVKQNVLSSFDGQYHFLICGFPWIQKKTKYKQKRKETPYHPIGWEGSGYPMAAEWRSHRIWRLVRPAVPDDLRSWGGRKIKIKTLSSFVYPNITFCCVWAVVVTEIRTYRSKTMTYWKPTTFYINILQLLFFFFFLVGSNDVIRQAPVRHHLDDEEHRDGFKPDAGYDDAVVQHGLLPGPCKHVHRQRRGDPETNKTI